MRFFKYLLFIFALIISIQAKADWYFVSAGATKTYKTGQEACETKYPEPAGVIFYQKYTTEGLCRINGKDIIYSDLKFINPACPAKGSLKVFYYPAGSTSVPTRVCQDGCTYEGGHAIDTPNHVAITMQATGDSQNCTNQTGPKQPPQCDKTDPYGGCYVPPNDDCLRLKDGSIQCPDNTKPPDNNTCNGADYCKRPPEGCGSGYVPGSFNGQQLCVRSGPNVPKNPPDPDKPDDPNNCMNGGSYCPQPPDNTSCPSGYYETTHNGSKICVKNNPDPDKPNPNDPNTDGGGGSSEPTDGGGDGGTGGSINLKPVIDAINALKNALLGALSGISGKIDKLINGQTETNKKLDTSNEHLDKIEDSSKAASESLGDIKDATQATSEAIGESNKKLDSMKEAIEGQYKCANENYDPNDKRSSKYRPCTEKDITGGSAEDTKVDVQEKSIDLDKDLRRDLFGGNSSCPPPLVIEFTFIDKVHLEFPYDLMCDGAALVRPWVILLGMLVSYFVITGQRSGGQD